MTETDVVREGICKVCETNNAEDGFELPLCSNCRNLLAKRPYPKWVSGFALLVIAISIFSSFRLPIVFKAVASERSANNAIAKGDYDNATVEFQKILALYPDSDDHKGKLAICHIKTGQIMDAVRVIKTIDESGLSKDVASELGALIASIAPPEQEEN